MKNKAFTLIELLGVIVLLGILGVVIIPKIGDSITNSKNTSLEVQEETIKKAAYDFLLENGGLFDNNESITIKLGILKQKGYLPKNIKNPKTQKNISNESRITITRLNDNERYRINVTIVDLEDVTEQIDSQAPIIVMNGNYIEYVEVFDEYQDKGVNAFTNDGRKIEDISSQILLNDVEHQIDTTKKLTYQIKYSVTYNEKTYFSTRTVIVRDTIPPVITLPKETRIKTNEVATYDLRENVSVIDNYDQTIELTINSGLSNLPGKYVVTYIASDSSGNETTERRVIIVE
jgi:type II secretory pathway pseudopilin PulG